MSERMIAYFKRYPTPNLIFAHSKQVKAHNHTAQKFSYQVTKFLFHALIVNKTQTHNPK